MLHEIIIDVDLESFCREYEVDCCLGKVSRIFRVPTSLIAEQAQINQLPEGFTLDPSQIWNEYPSLQSVGGDSSRDFVIYLAGGERDLADVDGWLSEAGYVVGALENASAGDAVVFCISTADGPMRDTREAVSGVVARGVQPVAIIQTRVATVDDESLQELVRHEMRELIGEFFGETVAKELPTLAGENPYLPELLLEILRSNP